MQQNSSSFKHVLRAILPVAAFGLLSVSVAQAALTVTGDVSPTDPSTWTTSTTAIIGNTADGTLTVNGGSTVTLKTGYLGRQAGVNGTVNIDGSGSSLTNSSNLLVAYGGTAKLSITNGGSVTSGAKGIIGYYTGNIGIATVDGSGSTWNTSGTCMLATGAPVR